MLKEKCKLVVVAFLIMEVKFGKNWKKVDGKIFQIW